ncbi:hypothetical protein SAMN06265222_11535 [Neorhodopirellula lusitana]|uniref:Uncharacterized protein n=1 Tax=Neorhodopirellula lusitana TaxID=445327 RepID=A0ABY1QLY7_9BACT|nr:hypothetical protein [Neorhodopirellula lusitana]SMP72277.1 hypothetical protein SAMN06265222_11535 [Neorhodopirellula lusitana]
MVRLQQIGFQFGAPRRGKNANNGFADRHPRNIRAAACVLNHYYFHLGKVPFGNTKKLIFRVPDPGMTEDGKSKFQCDPKFQYDSLGIGYCDLSYDYAATERLEGEPLKRSILDAVHEGCINYCRHFGITDQPCQDAFNGVLKDELRFGFYFNKKKSYRHQASGRKFLLYLKFDWNELSVVAEVYERRSLLGSAFLYSTTPSIDPWAMLIRKPGWSAHNEIVLEPIKISGGTTNCILALHDLEDGVKADTLAWSIQNPQPLG